ncbi:MAG TPA: dihydroorotate dehydrogenase-like protein [Bryobacteraceae bacterium]|nr:dihydroorotate dehydrogenase-like protein [Bryobacteraceae bacterium]
MIDLSTYYLGRKLRSPFVASSGPLSKDLRNLQKMEDAGAGAVVLHSLFEEQILMEGQSLDRFLSAGADSYAEFASYFPDIGPYDLGPRSYLQHLEAAKKALKIPVIASLNGSSLTGWVRYARDMENAGADAIELNIYFLPASFETSGAQIEESYCDLVSAVKAQVRIPVAVKLGPFFTSLPNIAYRLECAGAGALVLFNRFYQPDFDLEAMDAKPNLKLSTSDELLMRLHAVALLSSRLSVDLAVTGGVHTAEDAIKGIFAGAHVVMTTSALLQRGIDHLRHMQDDVVQWMQQHDYDSVSQMRGAMNAGNVGDPEVYQRANYLKTLGSYESRLQTR